VSVFRDSVAEKLLGVIEIRFFLFYQLVNVLAELLGVDSRVNSLARPAAHSIGYGKQIAAHRSSILTALVRFLVMRLQPDTRIEKVDFGFRKLFDLRC
jgi:hypothetical protein